MYTFILILYTGLLSPWLFCQASCTSWKLICHYLMHPKKMMYLFSYQLLLSVNEFSVFNSQSFEIFRRQGQNEVEIKWGQKILVYSTIYVHSEILFSTCLSWSHCLEVYMHLIIENQLKRTCNLWFVQWNLIDRKCKNFKHFINATEFVM